MDFEHQHEIPEGFWSEFDLGSGLGLRNRWNFLFLDLGLPDQIKGYDFLRFPVFEDLKIVNPQIIDESVAVENPDRDFDVDDPGGVMKFLRK
jgi:hypothetical protein